MVPPADHAVCQISSQGHCTGITLARWPHAWTKLTLTFTPTRTLARALLVLALMLMLALLRHRHWCLRFHSDFVIYHLPLWWTKSTPAHTDVQIEP